ncbi:sucrase ferredoxin [Jatrophihabitans sp. YIM 134969]
MTAAELPVSARSGHRPVPRESASRCALQAQLRGDPMLGTAPPSSRLLLVEQPGPWGPRGLADSRADPDVAVRIDRLAAAAGLRLQTIRRPGRHVDRGERGHVVALADARIGVTATSWWRVADLADLAEQLAADTRAGEFRPPTNAVVDADPLYLVCTHGRHDACCALRGRPLALELDQVRPGRVWETSHVGGDRFAANLLVLPTGEVYGRVLPFAAPDLVRRIEAGEVVPGLMRGRLGLAPIAQAALVIAHDRLAVTARDALQVGTVDRIADDFANVTVLSPAGTVVVGVAIETSSPHRLTCRGPAEATARVYRGVSVTAVR